MTPKRQRTNIPAGFSLSGSSLVSQPQLHINEPTTGASAAVVSKKPEKAKAVEKVLSITDHASYLKSISDDPSAMRKYIEKNFAFESVSDANFKLVDLKRILVDAECYEVAIIIRDYVKENAKGIAEQKKSEVEMGGVFGHPSTATRGGLNWQSEQPKYDSSSSDGD